MSIDHTQLGRRSAFTALSVESAGGPGLLVSDRDGIGIATVLERNAQCLHLAEAVAVHFQVELPQVSRRAASAAIAFACIGPGAWLCTHEGGREALHAALSLALVGVASISEQTDGYAVLRLSGPRVRDVLCRLVPLDVHTRTFKVGDVATTVAGHIGTILWRLDDSNDGAAVFEIALYRSFSAYFCRLLKACGA